MAAVSRERLRPGAGPPGFRHAARPMRTMTQETGVQLRLSTLTGIGRFPAWPAQLVMVPLPQVERQGSNDGFTASEDGCIRAGCCKGRFPPISNQYAP